MKNNKGQASVEWVLIVAVLVSMAFAMGAWNFQGGAFFAFIRNWYVGAGAAVARAGVK